MVIKIMKFVPLKSGGVNMLYEDDDYDDEEEQRPDEDEEI